MNIFIATVQDKIGTLTPEESWHCAKVLRKKTGDALRLMDGKGNFYDGILETVNEKVCRAKITAGPQAQAKRNYYLHLVIAPTKQIDRIEWMLEKAVEIGIDEISFVICKNSERTAIKTERMNKIAESAAKQSIQAFLPKVNEVMTFKELASKEFEGEKFIAHCFESEKIEIKKLNIDHNQLMIVIGPEGDFTKEEVEHALKNGFKSLSLGNTRLRTETAGLYVCQAASILNSGI